jgi:hypothetical protein
VEIEIMAKTIETFREGTVIRFEIADAGSFTIDLANLSPEISALAMAHGIVQKISDAAAIPRDTKTGRSATAGEKRAAMLVVRDRLVAGEWNARAKGETVSDSVLGQAIATVKGRPITAVAEWLAARTPEEKKALRLVPEIAAEIGRIVGRETPEGLFDGL